MPQLRASEDWVRERVGLGPAVACSEVHSLMLPAQDDERIEDLGSSLDNFSRLLQLVLSGNALRSTAGLSKLRSLEKLSLRDNYIAEWSEIEALPSYMPNLRDLDLRGNPISKRGNYRLGILLLLPALRVLDGTEVSGDRTDEGILRSARAAATAAASPRVPPAAGSPPGPRRASSPQREAAGRKHVAFTGDTKASSPPRAGPLPTSPSHAGDGTAAAAAAADGDDGDGYLHHHHQHQHRPDHHHPHPHHHRQEEDDDDIALLEEIAFSQQANLSALGLARGQWASAVRVRDAEIASLRDQLRNSQRRCAEAEEAKAALRAHVQQLESAHEFALFKNNERIDDAERRAEALQGQVASADHALAALADALGLVKEAQEALLVNNRRLEKEKDEASRAFAEERKQLLANFDELVRTVEWQAHIDTFATPASPPA